MRDSTGFEVLATNLEFCALHGLIDVETGDRHGFSGQRGIARAGDDTNLFSVGKNLVAEWYSVLGRYDRIEEIASAIVGSRPDLIFSMSGALTRALKPLTATIPILALTGDPIVGGIVTSLARPDGNITGVSADAGFGIHGKRFQYLVETARRLANVRFLMTTTGRWQWETTPLGALRDAAGRAGISIDAALVSTPVDQVAYEQVFEAMERDRVDGLLVADATDHLTYRQLIVDLAARYRLPAIYSNREFVDAGGLLSYGTNIEDVYRQAGIYVGRILKGEKPGELPIQQPTRFFTTLNRKRAAVLSINIPMQVLVMADEVIE